MQISTYKLAEIVAIIRRGYIIRQISQGKASTQAIKAVTKRVINIIYGLMKSGNAYIHPHQENISG